MSRGGSRPKTANITNSNSHNMYSNNHNNLGKMAEKSLTQQVWVNFFCKFKPKSKMLLSIASKMFRENLISLDQRGVLKELILDQDQNLSQFLNIYESSRNYTSLCENICKLISYQSNLND